jgi:hypothetical protein
VTTFKLYPISNHSSSTEFDLRSNEVLFVPGAIKMEILLPADGCFVWQGFSRYPWGSAPEAFAFMKI